MSATPPPGPPTRPPSSGGSGSDKLSSEDQTRIFYSRFLGWLVLAIILAYTGLQLPLPWRLLTVVAGLVGVVGGVVLFVQAVRKKLSAVVLVGAVLATLSCGMFLLTAGTQTIFWEASQAYEECTRAAVTERSLDRCFSEYEQDVFSVFPNAP